MMMVEPAQTPETPEQPRNRLSHEPRWGRFPAALEDASRRREHGRRRGALAALFLVGSALGGCGGDGATGGGDSEAEVTDTADSASPANDVGAEGGADAADGATQPGDTTGAADTTGEDTAEDAGSLPEPEALAWTGWDNAIVYFVITDRFFDGNPANNGSYGRALDGEDEVGTFHGGDLAGLTAKLEEGYFQRLGVGAIWVTAPYEQVHGWVVGGGGGFRHYAYHGYFALDYTRMDANMGTTDELRTFVDTAHEQGIRVVFDVVMNHPGYATATDLSAFGVDVLSPGWERATPQNYYDFFDFESPEFGNWWGPQWIRADLGGGYSSPGNDPLTRTVTFLPDFKTDSPVTGIALPPFYANKSDTAAVMRPDYRVRDYLIEWLTAWVEEYGIDGFRCDTAKHVELDAWAELKEAGHAALATWRANNPEKAFADSDYADPSRPFWMTGEVFPHGVVKDAYFDNGFDSLINFDFQDAAGAALDDAVAIDPVWTSMAAALNPDPDFDVLSYLSSHDTSLFFDKWSKSSLDKQHRAAALLLLAPGGVQIFYGDENGRPIGPNGGDAMQGTRSDYRWGDNPQLLDHWRRIGVFRKRHRAVGVGAHNKLSDAPYVFSRTLAGEAGGPGDAVVVALNALGPATVSVGAVFAEGSEVRNAYDGALGIVTGGKVSFDGGSQGVILIEAASAEGEQR
jgi:alpha-amylase